MRGGRQVVRVIAQPQRGHCVAVPAQVVPQEEQVLVQLEQRYAKLDVANLSREEISTPARIAALLE